MPREKIPKVDKKKTLVYRIEPPMNFSPEMRRITKSVISFPIEYILGSNSAYFGHSTKSISPTPYMWPWVKGASSSFWYIAGCYRTNTISVISACKWNLYNQKNITSAILNQFAWFTWLRRFDNAYWSNWLTSHHPLSIKMG